MKDVDYIICNTDKDKKDALLLIKKEYSKQGYINSFVPKIDMPKNSVTFLAKHVNRIIGTISVTIDSNSGLPIDEIYKKEIDKLRAQNRKIVEVGRFATDREFLSKEKYNNLLLVMSLFKLVFHYCIYRNIDNICISINPKHNLFYKSMFFSDIGGLKSCPTVNNAPAIAKTLDINKLKNKKTKNYLLDKLFWSNPPCYKIFENIQSIK